MFTPFCAELFYDIVYKHYLSASIDWLINLLWFCTKDFECKFVKSNCLVCTLLLKTSDVEESCGFDVGGSSIWLASLTKWKWMPEPRRRLTIKWKFLSYSNPLIFWASSISSSSRSMICCTLLLKSLSRLVSAIQPSAAGASFLLLFLKQVMTLELLIQSARIKLLSRPFFSDFFS